MSQFGSPLKPKKVKVEKEEVWKKEKKVLSASVVKKLLDWDEEVGDGVIRWTEQWLVQLVRERSLPPQIAGSDVMGALVHYLTPCDAVEVLAKIRKEFRDTHPIYFPKEDWTFLEAAFEKEGIQLSSLDHLLQRVC
jgi:hypothetical protein